MKCNFIGIGVQKAASTWIYRVLEDHPEVVVSQPKELDFFSYNYEKGVEWYESFFKKTTENTLKLGEISPSYFNDVNAVIRAKEYNPDFKIVVILRDPVERAYSNHLHLIRIGQYKGKDNTFETGLNAHPEYLEQSRYYQHLSCWFEHFPPKNILVLIQEDISNNPKKIAERLYQFLDINPGHKSVYLERKQNVSYIEKYKGVDACLKKVGTFLRRVGLASLVHKIKNSDCVVKLRDKNRVLLNTVTPKMKKSTEEKLMCELSDEVFKLKNLLNVESFPWKTWQYIKEQDK